MEPHSSIIVTNRGQEFSVTQKNGAWRIYPTPLYAVEEIEIMQKANRTVNGYYESLQGSIYYMEGLVVTRITNHVSKLAGELLDSIAIDEDPTRSGYDSAFPPKIVFYTKEEFEINRTRPRAAAPLGLRAIFSPQDGKSGWTIMVDTGTGAQAASRLRAWLPSSDPAIGRIVEYINRYTRVER
jgi:hypothetical protein